MKIITIVISLIMALSTQVMAQKSAEERINENAELLSEVANKKVWDAYINGDYDLALKHWRPLAETGDAAAQVNLGVMYNQGHGVVHDDSEAVKWYKLAADQGYSPAQWRLAVMYKTGTGVIQNYEEAFKLYKLVAEQGDAYAQNTLGVMFSNGFGVPQDNIKAYLWFTVAGDSGYAFGAKEKDQVLKKMEAEDISTAQEMASKCIQFDYKNCGEY
tara:strand:+ start:38 stop:685 length:648 start_codon:yes stop_codon:yes gene_type:complete